MDRLVKWKSIHGLLRLSHYILKFLQYRFPKFGRIVEGDATILIYKGKILDSHLKIAKITTDELLEAVREHGVASVKEVDLAIFEIDGTISVLSNMYQKETVKRRKAHKILNKREG
ncbi:DUF421 domain-containing protein [Segatella paludivivens]|uniref:DUF421 domain-containing protein n=1 Tax=Segatella paludivivens TaxID=185294 RepID=UPI0003785C7F|nr:YetF domain-containing protein [Segatella paludivivens]